MVNGWKVAFWILFAIFVIETISIGFIIYEGISILNDESECSINICDKYDSYFFDSIEDICYCFEDGEVVYQEYIK